MENLQSWLYAHKTKIGKTPKEIAKDTGVSEFTLYKILQGKNNNPLSETLTKLCIYFNEDMNIFKEIYKKTK